jgi:hypothetical protein
MANYDPKVTEGMVAWLRSDHTDDESIRKGAELLLRVNRNKGLYERILRYPKGGLKKLEYELQKHLNIRLQGYSYDDIQKLDQEIMPEIKNYVEKCNVVIQEDAAQNQQVNEADVMPIGAADGNPLITTGKRPDHDQLPSEIQEIWTKNAERWKKIKELYNLLLTLNAPCDRFEHLQLLKELWYKYREDMCRYDDFRGTMDEMVTLNKGGQLTEDEQRDIDVAQSYISRNLPVLQELVLESREPDFPEDKIAKLEDLRSKIQARVTSLLMLNVMLSDQRKADLVSCDIAIELSQDDAQGEGSE